MYKIGEIQKAGEIGYRGANKFIWLACPDCGKERWVTLRQGKSKHTKCLQCHLAKGTHHPKWRNGTKIHQNGYILVKLYPSDFFYPMVQKTGYMFEHRLVMAQHLGRCLLSWEIVHHKNGICDDNRIENLQLLPAQHQHIIDSLVKKRITQLEKRVALLEAENQLLHTKLADKLLVY